jgi:hypothetical protein
MRKQPNPIIQKEDDKSTQGKANKTIDAHMHSHKYILKHMRTHMHPFIHTYIQYLSPYLVTMTAMSGLTFLTRMSSTMSMTAEFNKL